MELPLVSIIIPNFNREAFIAETLESLLDQSYSNWEAIIVDDGSTDNSESIINEFCLKDERFHLFKRDHFPKGAPTCRNIGIQMAKGEYLIFLDSDDILAPYCLRKRIDYFLEFPNYDCLVFPMLIFYKRPGDSPVLWNGYKGEDALSEFLWMNSPWQTTGPLWKKSSVLRITNWDEELLTWQDWEFHIRALIMGMSYKIIDDLPDCFLRRDDHDRISAKDYYFSHFQARLPLFEKVLNLLITHNKLLPSYKKSFTFHYFSHAVRTAMFWPKGELSLSYMHRMKHHRLVSSMVYLLLYIYIRSLAYSKNFKLNIINLLLYKSGYRLLPKYFLLGKAGSTKGMNLSELEFMSVKKLISKQHV